MLTVVVGGGVIEDNLCAFRCLAYHRTQNRKGTERLTLRYYREYFGHRIPKNAKFKGLSLEEIPQFENSFDINVNIFQLFEDETCVHIYRSRGVYQDTKKSKFVRKPLDLYKRLSGVLQKYECRNCKTPFPTHDKVSRHEMRCKEATKYTYTGGYYARPQHIFEELEYLDIEVDKDLRFYPFLIAYDFEALLQTNDLPPATDKSTWTHEHRPVSFSICSNVPGHVDPVCEIDNNVSSLIQKFVNKALEIQSTAETYTRTRFANVLKKLSRESKLIQELSEEMIYQDDDDVNDDDETHNQAINTPLINHIRRIRQKLDTYITEIPVLGYNSSKYDLNLIKASSRIVLIYPIAERILSLKNVISICASAMFRHQ